MAIQTLSLGVLLLLCLQYHANAWVLNKEALQRAASVASISAVIVAAPMGADAVVDLAGSYSDPKHPNCLRVIEIKDKGRAAVSGTDGTPGCPPDGSGRVWNLEGKVNGNDILVDFTPKGGPKDLLGKWEEEAPAGIRWPDGNKWTVNK
ncbi:expressed unknown protein [Seminavis robusta]|uniref:Uncharacterized protein n=1 Tax=Seminavis robusta TaxID=568900 RepID=A0A9N8HAI4_9STRA|nr:expressed unknown protein [Seminavis robusta]|eukprot:Sro149_g068570.1 n/a (149) ;mRNA; f:71688-72134